MKISHKNAYDKIGRFLMCYPCNFKVKNKDVDYEKMYRQYNNFINLLCDEGADLHFLTPIYGANQVFVRDVGFIIDDILFISKMGKKDRIDETKALEEYIKGENNIHSYKMQNYIEGGDVIIHNEFIFVGISKRTGYEAAKELQDYLTKNNKNYKVVTINFNCDIMLHLDCVFNILNKDSCILSKYIYNTEEIESRIKNCYYIDDKTTRELGTNLISLGDNRLFISNKTVYGILSNRAFKCFYIDFSEILKAGGGLTCSTLPIYRE
ncbi:dimethylarginine dimethylaminohydrolase family protein [Clostridium mediterraneense]|uniref:dimethylarginine dimethylaminohydrolase family protein n=1 Tax=Clostridium mediterraneense TaxID=1805472 RepID=UPI000835DA28|nr:arginine deiminase family protein [Clostridium mediterraneense]